MSMNTTAELETLLQSVPRRFRELDRAEMVRPRSEGKWSRLQILGHLCDSAIHNLSRFIQIQDQAEPMSIIPYKQERWVEAMQYAKASPEEVIGLWLSLNQSVVRVISNLPPASLSRACQLADGSMVTLEWLIEDYLAHMKHHLQQLLPDGLL